eukprot:17009-Heterococcus_DN1.PRE.2
MLPTASQFSANMIVRWDDPAPCSKCKSKFAQCASAGFPGGDFLTDKKPVTEAIWMQSTGGITKCILVHIDGELQPQSLHEWLKTVVFADMVCDCRERMKLARKPWPGKAKVNDWMKTLTYLLQHDNIVASTRYEVISTGTGAARTITATNVSVTFHDLSHVT